MVEALIKRRYIKAYINEREEQELVVFASAGQLRPVGVLYHVNRDIYAGNACLSNCLLASMRRGTRSLR